MTGFFVRISRVFLPVLVMFGGCLQAYAQDVSTIASTARAETETVPTEKDSADDPAIWIHPTDPSKSLVLGTNKKGGLHAYSLNGKQRQLISPAARPNNVDVLYGFNLAGRRVDLAIASSRPSGKSAGLRFWAIDPAEGQLSELNEGRVLPTFGGNDSYGVCTYRGSKGVDYVIVTNHQGGVEQYQLEADREESVKMTRVRSLTFASQIEGCVADRETGRLYLGEEDAGIWECGAEPDSKDERVMIAKVGDHGLTADVEGLALYYAQGGGGYLLASNQGDNSIAVFDRAAPHAYKLTIRGKADKFATFAENDGVEVTNERLSSVYPKGLLVVHDGKNNGRQNFKLFGWEDVAGDRLLTDTSLSVRSVKQP